MDTENLTMESKCENLMTMVVESRKMYGKMCVDYDQKLSLIENKILNLQIETFSNYHFKSKRPLPSFGSNDFKDFEDFSMELLKQHKRIDDLRKKLKDTQEVVLQLKADDIGKKLREPLTAEAMLLQAKEKNML